MGAPGGAAELLLTGQVEGPVAEQIQQQMDLLKGMMDIMDTIDSSYLGQAAVGQNSNIGEAISGSAQIVQNDITFAVNAQNFFSTKTEMMNIAREMLLMMKQQNWVEPAAINI